jgi:uncharacterized membrane protein required for colicin V production
MTIYDALMAAVVIGGMVWGAWRGIIWQLAGIGSLVLGYSVAHALSAQLAPHFPGEPVVARALAMMVVYAAVSGGVFLVAWLLRATLRQLKFEAYDRHLGMVLGGLEGVCLGLVATTFVVSLSPASRGPIFQSPTGHVVGPVMSAIGPVLPSEVRDVLAPFFKDSSEALAADPPANLPAEKARGKTATGSLREMLDEEESRLGRAIVDSAKKELKQTGDTDAGAVERR